MPRVAQPLTLTDEERTQLTAMANSQTLPYRQVLRAKIILGCSEPRRIDQLAASLGISEVSVRKWRRRFMEQGLEGLNDAPRSGRTPVYGPEIKERILNKLKETPPDGLCRWDGGTLSRELNIPDYKVWEILRQEGIQLRRMRSWCVSKDPEFQKKIC